MRLYETTFIVNPQTDDSAIDTSVKDVLELIQGNGGKVVHENRMGTRRMAYPIQGLTQGYYTYVAFEAPTELLPVLDRHYRLGEAYIRNLTVRFEGDITRLTEPKEEPKFAGRDRGPSRGDRPVARRRPEAAAETTKEGPKPDKPVTKEAPPVSADSAEVVKKTEAPTEPVAVEQKTEAPKVEPVVTKATEQKKADSPEAAGETKKPDEPEDKEMEEL